MDSSNGAGQIAEAASTPAQITDADTQAPAKTLGPDKYDPTAEEIAAIQRYSAKKRLTKTPRITVERTSGNTCTVSYDHEALGLAQILLSDAIGCADPDFREGLLYDLINASISKGGKISDTQLNMGLAIVKDIKPTDAIEAMLAAQMFAIHSATMTYASRTIQNELMDDPAEPRLNRLSRTFATLVDSLKRYRSTGESTVRVERVYVGEGGQAIVGNVAQGGGSTNSQKEGQIHGHTGRTLLAPPSSTALPIDLTANKTPLRSARGEGQDTLPLPRRTRRRAKGQQEQSPARS